RAKPSSAIIEIQKGGAEQPFNFLHGDYAGSGYYCMRLARHLGPERPFYALPPCGVNRSPVPRTYGAMAPHYLQELRRRQPHGPYFLGGTCNGGLVASEMARKLLAEGERVDALILLGASVANLRFWPLRQLLAPLRLVSEPAADRLFTWVRLRLVILMSTP